MIYHFANCLMCMIVASNWLVCKVDDYIKIEPRYDELSTTGIYIPKDIDECIEEINSMLSNAAKERIRNNDENMADYHFRLGRWLRNNWGLWGKSRLHIWFKERGIFHADDMSAIILTTYWRYLNKKPLGIAEQIDWYVHYWNVRRKPKAWKCPGSGENIAVKYGLYSDREERKKNEEIYLHVGYCKETKEYYVYRLGKGWYRPSQVIRNRIYELEKQGTADLIEAPIISKE